MLKSFLGNPLTCTEKIHILQQGIGVFIPNNKDFICKNKEKETNNSINNINPNSTNYDLTTNLYSTEEVAFKQLIVNEQTTESSLLQKIHKIRPLQIKNLTVNLNSQYLKYKN